jgi:hypothetical protein
VPKEILDVLDTAVKIGLGATISGLTAFFVGRSNHKNEKNKFLLEHRLRTIESATEGFEEYFKSSTRFISQVSGIERKRKNSGKTGVPYSANEIKAIRARNGELIESWKSRDIAVSKLRLLSAHEALDVFTEINEIEKTFRDCIIFEGLTPNYEEIEAAKNNLKERIKEFHKKIADFYVSIST